MSKFLVIEVKKHVVKYVGRTDVKYTYEVIGVVDEETAEEKFSKNISCESAGSGMFIGFRWYKVLDNDELELYCNEYGEYVGYDEEDTEEENVAENNISKESAVDSTYVELIDIDGAEHSFEDGKKIVLSVVTGNPLLERAINDTQNVLSLVAITNLVFGARTARLVKREDNALAIYDDAINSLKKIISNYIERAEYADAKRSLNDLEYWEIRKDEMLGEIRKGASYLERNLPIFYTLVDDSLF